MSVGDFEGAGVRNIAKVGAGLATVVLAMAVGLPSAAAAVTSGTIGADISYPQCSATGGAPSEPSAGSAAFGIVGVDNGRPGAANSCLAAEYQWASALPGSPALYVNTADPGNTVADWPTGAIAGGPQNPYGPCVTVRSRGKLAGADSQACAFEYGVEQADNDLRFAAAAGASTTSWWLDVEAANTWQKRRLLDLNQAVLDGMDRTFTASGTGPTVGVYSTAYQWGTIVGTLTGAALGDLGAVPQWIPTGGSSEAAAAADCSGTSLPRFDQGPLTFVQYTTSFDYDYAC
ncbi:hypothetical protein GHK86_01850 [Acidimicrobiaceae bacterium USS-CC1]|uniref:Tannase/feruloyl esterase family alpha/beta hydrolase n=1 Tax=Acidiferrimicrobium australe TaxID=2664430 RepID=A0ABW9QPV0_9ACTN|nr:hypothetical protein [Acidiferrimicrobium australe]